MRWQQTRRFRLIFQKVFHRTLELSCLVSKKIFIDLFYDHVALSRIFYDYNFDLNRMSPRRSSSLSILEIQDSFLWCIFMALPSFTKARAKICTRWWGSGNELPEKERSKKTKIKDWKFKSDIKFNVAHFIVRRTLWNGSTRTVRGGWKVVDMEWHLS